MTPPTLPIWWPLSGYDPITEDQVRELFAYLKTVMPPVMADARRRIQARVGDQPIEVHPETVKSLAGLGSVAVVPIVHLRSERLMNTTKLDRIAFTRLAHTERASPATRADQLQAYSIELLY